MSVTRLTGLTSGMDTDTLIKDLMKIERMKYDNLDKDRQYVEWKQEAYRSTIKQVDAFQSEYLDIINQKTGVRSASSFAEFSSTVEVNGESKNYVTVGGSASLKELNHTITRIDQLATKDTWVSKTSTASSIVSGKIDTDQLNKLKENGLKINLKIDGNIKEINFSYTDMASVSSVDELITKLNDEIKNQFGDDYSGIVDKIAVADGFGFKIDYPGNAIRVYDISSPDVLDNLISSSPAENAEGEKTFPKSGIVDDTRLAELKEQGVKFNLTIGEDEKEIEMTADELSGVTNLDELITGLNTKIETAFGGGFDDLVSKVTLTDGDGFQIKREDTDIRVSASESYGTLAVFDLKSGEGTDNYESKSIGELFNLTADDLDDFRINGKKIEGLTTETTLKNFMDAINRSATGAVISYNSLEDRFTLSGKATGTLNNIDFSESADAMTIFGALGFDTAGTDGGDGSGGTAYRAKAQNAIFTLDGFQVVKDKNEFSIDGAKYTLNSVYTDESNPIEITLKNDTDKVKDKIKKFVEDYNALIKSLNSSIDERKTARERAYKPLTSEEKKALSEDEIKQWEKKAKIGILSRDTVITNMLDRMRSAFFAPVEGSNITITEMGISTSKNYKDRGKLVIDEKKLDEALETKFTDVVQLFTATSDKEYLDDENKTERYNESGISNRLNDIISDAIRTTRNTDGLKGSLVEKAGLVDDASVVNNALSKELKSYDDRLEELLKLLESKEDSYYRSFAKMEAALAKLSQQSASLMQQFGG